MTTQTRTWTAWLGAGAVVLASVAGCADRNKNGEPESPATGGEVKNAVSSAAPAVEAAGDAAVITPKIKTALGANAALKGSNIDVDTDGKTNTVHLKGTVLNAAQKNAAAAIAKKEAPNFTISNELTQTGGAPAAAKKPM